MKENKLNIAYTILIGLFITLFVGLGVAAFYEEPKHPEYPSSAEIVPYGTDTDSQDKSSPAVVKYEQEVKKHDEELSVYNRNTSFILLGLAIVVLAGSFYAHRKKNIFADSLLIGGVGVVIYGALRGMSMDDLRLTFIYVAISLVALTFVGYHRFSTPKKKI